MEITTRGRYAIHIMADIARCNGQFVSLAEIAEKHKISIKYLEKVMPMLIKAKLVKSARGSAGGYKLNAQAEKITIKSILDATGDGAKIADCLGEDCPKKRGCDTFLVCNTLKDLIDNYLESISLQDLINKTYKH